jgi:hypothetical protein
VGGAVAAGAAGGLGEHPIAAGTLQGVDLKGQPGSRASVLAPERWDCGLSIRPKQDPASGLPLRFIDSAGCWKVANAREPLVVLIALPGCLAP